MPFVRIASAGRPDLIAVADEVDAVRSLIEAASMATGWLPPHQAGPALAILNIVSERLAGTHRRCAGGGARHAGVDKRGVRLNARRP
jgi:hypothetical protein